MAEVFYNYNLKSPRLTYSYSSAKLKMAGFNLAAFTNRLVLDIDLEAQKSGNRLVSMYGRLTLNWERENRPQFKIRTRTSGKSVSVTVTTDSDIWKFVSNGTSVRYAVMTYPYQPQTSWGSLTSLPKRRGQGLNYVMRRSSKTPKPGIAPRNFEMAALEREAPVFKSRVYKVFWDDLETYVAKALGAP